MKFAICRRSGSRPSSRGRPNKSSSQRRGNLLDNRAAGAHAYNPPLLSQPLTSQSAASGSGSRPADDEAEVPRTGTRDQTRTAHATKSSMTSRSRPHVRAAPRPGLPATVRSLRRSERPGVECVSILGHDLGNAREQRAEVVGHCTFANRDLSSKIASIGPGSTSFCSAR